MSEKAPVHKNLYLLDLNCNVVDSIEYPAAIYDILSEPSSDSPADPFSAETFLVLSHRNTVSVELAGPVVLVTPKTNALYSLTVHGEELIGKDSRGKATDNKIIVRSTVSLNVDGTRSKAVSFTYDTQPKVPIESTYTTNPKFDVQGPPLSEGTCGLLLPLSQSIAGITVTGQTLSPKWSLARMDLGLTVRERVDLGGTPQSICLGPNDSNGNTTYYTITAPITPSTRFPSGVSSTTATGLVTLYVPQPVEYADPKGTCKSFGQLQIPEVAYLQPTGGEVTELLAYGGNIFQGGGQIPTSSIVPPTVITIGSGGGSGPAPDCTEAYRRMAVYFGTTITITKVNELSLTARTSDFTGGASVPLTTLGGGALERVTPRYTLFKLNNSLNINAATEWDHDLYVGNLSSQTDQGNLYTRDNLIYLGTNRDLVVAGIDRTVSTKVPHTIYPNINGTSAIFQPTVSAPLGGLYGPYTIQFYLGSVAISAPLPMTTFYAPYNLGAIASVYNAYLGSGSVAVDSVSQQLIFTGKYSFTSMPAPGFVIGPTGTFYGFINPGHLYAFSFGQGGPAVFGVPSFVQGFNISGRNSPSDRYRIRFLSTPGVSLNGYTTATTIPATIGVAFNFGLPQLPRSESLRLKYRGVWANGVLRTSVGWDSSTTGANAVDRVAALKALLTAATSSVVPTVTWVADGLTSSGQVRFKTTSSAIKAEDFELDPGYGYSDPLTLGDSLASLTSALTTLGFDNVQQDLDNKPLDGPVRFRSTSPQRGPIAIDLMLEGADGTDKTKSDHRIFDRVILGVSNLDSGSASAPSMAATVPIKSLQHPQEQYPRDFNENAIIAESTALTGKICRNNYEEYYVDGICRYSKDHVLLGQLTANGRASNQRLYSVINDLVIGASLGGKVPIYDRTLVLQGTLTAPTGWDFMPGSLQGTTTDKYGNWYVLATDLSILKFDSSYHYIGGGQSYIPSNIRVILGNIVNPIQTSMKIVGNYIILGFAM